MPGRDARPRSRGQWWSRCAHPKATPDPHRCQESVSKTRTTMDSRLIDSMEAVQTGPGMGHKKLRPGNDSAGQHGASGERAAMRHVRHASTFVLLLCAVGLVPMVVSGCGGNGGGGGGGGPSQVEITITNC